MPKLKEIVKKVNIICATSCPSESAFSIAGYIERKSRSRLNSKTLRYTILCKEESKIKNIRLLI